MWFAFLLLMLQGYGIMLLTMVSRDSDEDEHAWERVWIHLITMAVNGTSFKHGIC